MPPVDKSTIEDKIETEILNKRRVFLSDQVDQNTAKDVIRKLWYLESLDNKKPILFIINSPGGSVDSGFAIWDQIKMLSCPVYTLCTGLAASMGSLLLLVAEKGKRFATENSRIMIHQPLISGVIRGQATDLDIQAKEMLKTREMIVQIYSDATGKDFETINKAIDRDNWMSAEEAKKFGLLDKVIKSYKELNV
ncbi:MAG: ATP-dependent Clp protease proteolytic subunit [Chlamydiae bacterium RIFCSPHIGHO2_12_FULL_27_8]|nr:MAG: ATP-dependent Clp protease proteolytic subunit [Chlamydiae bacterium RIFCSPHIGHO2_12_FULL_27_8]